VLSLENEDGYRRPLSAAAHLSDCQSSAYTWTIYDILVVLLADLTPQTACKADIQDIAERLDTWEDNVCRRESGGTQAE